MVQCQMLPIVYVSRKLKECECKYATVEKECLAIVWTIQTFQISNVHLFVWSGVHFSVFIRLRSQTQGSCTGLFAYNPTCLESLPSKAKIMWAPTTIYEN